MMVSLSQASPAQVGMIASSRRPFPRAPLAGAAGLMLFSIGLAILGRASGSTNVPVARPIATRQLQFIDQPDGGIAVIDAQNGRTVDTVTGQAGFLRATMRGLASQRRRAALDLNPPFKLTAWQDGRLTLDDPTDGRHIELEAFGITNETVFAHLLADPEHHAGGGA